MSHTSPASRFGAPGAYVPGSDITLKVAAIRGVESNGMMCSERELELSDEHNGIIELPEDAPVGERYTSYAGLDDPLFDVAVTPNRGDAMGVYGVEGVSGLPHDSAVCAALPRVVLVAAFARKS